MLMLSYANYSSKWVAVVSTNYYYSNQDHSHAAPKQTKEPKQEQPIAKSKFILN